MKKRIPTQFARFWSAIVVAAALVLAPIARAGAQVLPATAGAVGGFVAGTIVTTGAVVLEARLGRYIYGMDDFISVRPELLPIVLFPVTGIVLGATSPETLGRAGAGAAIGLAGGALIGMGVGHILWETTEGRWAGGIIGGATGIVAGAVINSTRRSKNSNAAQLPAAAFSLKVPWGGRAKGNRDGGDRE